MNKRININIPNKNFQFPIPNSQFPITPWFLFTVTLFLLLKSSVFAVTKWELKTEFELQANWVGALDIDDDGIDEIIMAVDFTSLSGEQRGNIYFIEDQRRNILRQINFADEKYIFLDAVDLDGKLPKDLLFQKTDNETLYVQTILNMGRRDKRLKIASGKDIRLPEGWDGNINQVGISDINKDGFDDLICFISTAFDLQPRGVMVYDYRNEREIWHFWLGGTPTPKAGYLGDCYLKDTDGDGVDEIIFGTTAPCNGSIANGIDDFHSYVVVLDCNGNLVWKRQVGDASTITTIWCGDFDKDGQIEIVACERGGLADNKEPNSLFILDGKTGEIERYINTGEKFLGMDVCDLNRDGRLEIITGNSDGKIRVFDDLLNLIQETSFSSKVRLHAACDFDGDGTTELLVSTMDGCVFILNEKLETIAEKQIIQRASGVRAVIVKCDKRKKILFETSNGRPFTFKLMSVVPVGPLATKTPRFFFAVISCFIILIGMVMVNNYIQSTRRIRKVKKATDLLPFGIIMLDSKNRIIFVNNSAIRMFRKEGIVLLKKPVDTLVGGEDPKPMVNWLENAQGAFKFNIRSGTEVRELEASLYPINSERLIVVEDKTTKYTSERIISWAGFAQKLAHEIKNPLSTVTLTLQRLQMVYRKKLGSETKSLDSYTDSILEEIERLKRTTDKFMRILSLEKPVFEPNDINLLIDNTIEKYEKILPEKVKIRKSYDKNIPLIRCDGNQITVLLSNLFENAFEAMKGVGTLTVKTLLIERIINNRIKKFVEIDIEDTGEGISENDQKNLFKPFFSTKDGGTGLGLLISKQVAEKHNGKIELRSKPGIGTIVSVLLPIEEISNEE